MFRILSLAIFKEYRNFKTYTELLHGLSIVKGKIYNSNMLI